MRRTKSFRLSAIGARVAELPEKLRGDLLTLFKTSEEERDEIQKYLADQIPRGT